MAILCGKKEHRYWDSSRLHRHNGCSIGELVKNIRTQLYDMTQIQYAEFIKVSDKTLRDIEKGNTDTRVSVLNKVLAPGGFTLSARALRTRL